MTAPDTLRGSPSGNLGEEQDNPKLPTAPQSPAPLGDGVRKSQGTFLSPLCARVPRNPSSEIKPNQTQPDQAPPAPGAPFRPQPVRQDRFGTAAYPNIFISSINPIPPYQPSGGKAGAGGREVWEEPSLDLPTRGSLPVQSGGTHPHAPDHVLEALRLEGRGSLWTEEGAGRLQMFIPGLPGPRINGRPLKSSSSPEILWSQGNKLNPNFRLWFKN